MCSSPRFFHLKVICIKMGHGSMTNTERRVTDVDNTTETEQDLGGTFDRSLKFRQHIGTVAKKTNQMINLIKHAFTHIDCNLIYTALVRPDLDYDDTIWEKNTQQTRHKKIYILAMRIPGLELPYTISRGSTKQSMH